MGSSWNKMGLEVGVGDWGVWHWLHRTETAQRELQDVLPVSAATFYLLMSLTPSSLSFPLPKGGLYGHACRGVLGRQMILTWSPTGAKRLIKHQNCHGHVQQVFGRGVVFMCYSCSGERCFIPLEIFPTHQKHSNISNSSHLTLQQWNTNIQLFSVPHYSLGSTSSLYEHSFPVLIHSGIFLCFSFITQASWLAGAY